jgi:Transglycosylase SLT domain
VCAITVSTSNDTSAAAKRITPICEQQIHDTAKKEGIPLGLLYAVALTETGVGGWLSPYALNIEGVSFVAKSRSEALAAFQTAQQDGKMLIDVGCMQINYYYHHTGFAKTEDMFDPKLNISYAAKFLKSLRRRHGSWTEAVARYHAGPKNKVARHRYVCKVMRHLVTTNFGGWTPEADAFCQKKIQ